MNLHFISEGKEEIEKMLATQDYTERDVLNLSCLSNSICAIIHSMSNFHMSGNDDEEIDLPIYNLLEVLMKTIDQFLFNGEIQKTPKTKEEPAESGITN